MKGRSGRRPNIQDRHRAGIESMMMHVAPQCAVVDGVLNINKEAGWTSHDIVAKMRRLLGGVKVGHAGTLDPMATGVLPVLIGRGTRIAEYLVEWDKEYEAVLRLGETTDTQDATGTVLERRSTEAVTPEAIRTAAARFRGSLEQVPPMYSAVKVGGVPLYKAARAGKTIAREPRTIVLHVLEVVAIHERDVTLRVVCSKGTYVRTLCADIGEALGVGGHLWSLVRTRVGPFSLDQALTVGDVATHHALGRLEHDVHSLDQVLEQLPCVEIDDRAAARVKHGAPVSPEGVVSGHEAAAGMKPGTPIRINDSQGRLLAIGRSPESQSHPMRIEKVLMSQDS
jgi:tRNA pseudouridine55 synthase